MTSSNKRKPKPLTADTQASSRSEDLIRSLEHLVFNSTEGVLQDLLDAIPDLVWLKDNDGVYLFCNAAFERFFGASRQQILGKTDYDFVDSELADFFRKHDLSSVANGKASINEEWLTFASNGYIGLFETIKSPLRDAEGQRLGVLGVARDISKLNTVRESLRERQSMLETIVNLAGNAIVLVDPETGGMLEFNEAAYRNLGYSRDEFSELTIFDLDELTEIQVRKKFDRILEAGKLSFETRHRHRDGHYRNVVVSTSVIELQGRAYIESSWTDISEIRQAEQALRIRECELARAQQVARIGSWSLNAETGELRWSDETYRIFGIPVGQPIDYAGFIARVHPEDVAEVRDAWSNAMQGAPYDIRHRIIVDGETRWVHEQAELETEHEGQLFKGVGTVQDITESWRDHLLQETSNATLHSLAQGNSLSAVLTTLATGLESINPEMFASIFLLEPGGAGLTLGAAPRLNPGFAQALASLGMERVPAMFKAAINNVQTSVLDDITQAQDWVELLGLVKAAGFRSCWCRPVLSKEGQVLGVFAVFYQRPGLSLTADQVLVESLAGLTTQVIEQTRVQDALHLSSRVIEYSHSAITVTDAQGYIIATNPAFTQLSGYTQDEVIGRKPDVLRSGLQSETLNDSFWKALEEDGYWRGEIWSRRKDGSRYLQWLTASAVRDSKGAITHFIGISDDITENKEAMERIDFLAYHDPLTELPNRQLARDRMEQELTRAKREVDARFALLFVDLDQFKSINDALGHTQGDDLIRAAAERLVETVRETDTVSRQGGDEFLIMLTGDIEMHAVSSICTKVLSAMARPFDLAGQRVSISASIGVAMYPDDGTCFDSLMKKADMAMYSAKEAGRNAYRFFTNKMNVDVMDRIMVRNSLLRALERREFVLHYQPQLDIKSGHIVGVEALIRWENPDIGIVPPDRFIPVAESSGLIVEIGRRVLQEACRQLKAWQEEFGLADFVMAVNISALQFTRGDLYEAVSSAIRESGIDASNLELELTESILLKEADQALEVMSRLRKLGVKMSIDDFGTGYSSMAYLKRLSVDKLKIDRSFVKDIDVDSEDAAIAHAVISLGHILGLTIIAEGVENEAQLAFLHAHGCDQYQGYYYSRPLPAAECGRLLSKN
ncbi:EAL domain-containing protein [Marinobacterium stanieri]|uniref:cyclic-guanylate-specific phosphodiesterase n=1 Tax=Marinobacterium stanieri TaxID=49186 RepID=A0A1N6RF70_9GAMM|nr:EAL domain-containing protein [Marinobacterium stanieri]SIQ27538.1 PAS domain S-box-containing protein/diguanylate cyclase (GGDEF) domain-containing protein [Marinobacterium stanieri]